jgi:hypothetical protein
VVGARKSHLGFLILILVTFFAPPVLAFFAAFSASFSCLVFFGFLVSTLNFASGAEVSCESAIERKGEMVR